MVRRKILIEGIGGIGGVVAGSLTVEDYDVTLVTNNQNITNVINENGITYTDDKGTTQNIKHQALTTLDDIPTGEKFDWIFLIMKANSVNEAVANSTPFLNENGVFVSFQNGIVEDELINLVPKNQVLTAIVAWGGTMIEPGVYEKTSPGILVIGELDNKITHRIQELRDILANVSDIRISENIRGAQWAKLAINCTITTIGALTGQTLGELLRNKRERDLFLRTYAEVVDTAHALGYELESIGPNPYLLYRKANSNGIVRLVKDIIVQIAARKYKNTKPSMLQSFERGRKTEIDYLNGYVVEIAKNKGISVPVNQTLVKMIKEIEDKKRELALDNLEDLAVSVQN